MTKIIQCYIELRRPYLGFLRDMDVIACLNYLHYEFFKMLEELMRDVTDELSRMERNCESFFSGHDGEVWHCNLLMRHPFIRKSCEFLVDIGEDGYIT